MLDTYCSIRIDRKTLRKWCEDNLDGDWQIDSQTGESVFLVLTNEDDFILARLRWSNNENQFRVAYRFARTADGALIIPD